MMKPIYLLLLASSPWNNAVTAFAPSSRLIVVPNTNQKNRLPSCAVAQPREIGRRCRPLAAADSAAESGPNLNWSYLRQLAFNQALIGYSIWTGGSGAEVLARDAHFDGWALGVLGVLPLLLLSQQIETSESRLVANLNLSTNMTMLRLFGPAPQPALALPVSLFLACLTGIVEEVTFRGEVLPSLAQWSVDNYGFGSTTAIACGTVLSTVVFAALHVNPLGLIRGQEAVADAFVLFGLQLCTGATFAILYLSTGNLAVAIVAHAIYDFYTFYKTHLEVTTQMEYAEEGNIPAGKGTTEQKWLEERGDEFVREARQSFYLMDTDRNGLISRKELRIAMYSYGVKMSRAESEIIAKVADTDESGEIDFVEFLDFVGPAGSTSKAIKDSLLGVT